MACIDNEYDGIPLPSGSIKWTGGTDLKSVDLTIDLYKCGIKLNTLISLLDGNIDTLMKKGMDLSSYGPNGFIDNMQGIYLTNYIEKLNKWSLTVNTKLNALSEPSSIAQAQIPLNMSCLVGENCTTNTVGLLSAMEVMLQRICKHEGEINSIKAALTGSFDTATIYTPST